MVTTEFGKMEVKPNEICIIQVNICYKQITLDCYSVSLRLYILPAMLTNKEYNFWNLEMLTWFLRGEES